MEDPREREPNWSLDMAPVLYPRWAMCLARIVLNVLFRHERRKIGWRFLKFEVAVRSGLGMDRHWSAFQVGGMTFQSRRLENRSGRMEVAARWTAAIIL